MSILRRAAALAGGLALLAVPTSSGAMEQTLATGYNDGSKGAIKLIYGVNVPLAARDAPRTLGLYADCEYVPGTGFNTDHLPIVIESHAVAAPSWDGAPAISTSVLCEVVGPGGTLIATGATAGGATVAVGVGEVTLHDLGLLEVCVTVSARFTDTTSATSVRGCLPPDGIVASRT